MGFRVSSVILVRCEHKHRAMGLTGAVREGQASSHVHHTEGEFDEGHLDVRDTQPESPDTRSREDGVGKTAYRQSSRGPRGRRNVLLRADLVAAVRRPCNEANVNGSR